MSFLTLQEAADQLGVHYMTAYRYVRTGRLDASKEGALWQVDEADLKAFVDGKVPNGPTAALTMLDDAWLRLFKRLIVGDEAGCWNIIEDCLTSGMTPHNLYDRLIAPAMTEVGEHWANGDLDVADEHLATAITTRLIGRLGPKFVRPGRSRGTVVLAMLAHDNHGLASAMLADLLRLQRFDAIDLGANTPKESIIAAATRSDSVVAVGLCTLCNPDPTELPSALDALISAGFGGRVFVGGSAVSNSDLSAIVPAPGLTRSSQDAIDFVESAASTATSLAS